MVRWWAATFVYSTHTLYYSSNIHFPLIFQTCFLYNKPIYVRCFLWTSWQRCSGTGMSGNSGITRFSWLEWPRSMRTFIINGIKYVIILIKQVYDYRIQAYVRYHIHTETCDILHRVYRWDLAPETPDTWHRHSHCGVACRATCGVTCAKSATCTTPSFETHFNSFKSI